MIRVASSARALTAASVGGRAGGAVGASVALVEVLVPAHVVRDVVLVAVEVAEEAVEALAVRHAAGVWVAEVPLLRTHSEGAERHGWEFEAANNAKDHTEKGLHGVKRGVAHADHDCRVAEELERCWHQRILRQARRLGGAKENMLGPGMNRVATREQ